MKMENMENRPLEAAENNRCRYHRVNHVRTAAPRGPVQIRRFPLFQAMAGSGSSAASPASADAARPVAAGTICCR